jgi:hypothetical protein
MTEINIFGGGGVTLLAQVALLVLYYGGVYPNLPWWVVWFPYLITGGIIVGALVIFAIFIIIAAVFS